MELFASYLSQIGKAEEIIQMSRQILAQNMNFSPTWLITLVQKSKSMNQQNQVKFFGKQELIQILHYIDWICGNQQLYHILNYFNLKKNNKIPITKFINLLLPKNKESLKKIALNRQIQQVQLTTSLKYSLKRFFMNILQVGKQIRHQQCLINQIKNSSLFQLKNKDNLHKFMNKYNKYPTQKQVLLIYSYIENLFYIQDSEYKTKNQEVSNENILQKFESIVNPYKQNNKIEFEEPLSQINVRQIVFKNLHLQKLKVRKNRQCNQQKQNISSQKQNFIKQKALSKISTNQLLKIQSNSQNKRIILKNMINNDSPTQNIQKITTEQTNQIEKAAIISKKLQYDTQCSNSRTTQFIGQSKVSQTHSNASVYYPKRRKSNSMNINKENPCSKPLVKQSKQNLSK